MKNQTPKRDRRPVHWYVPAAGDGKAAACGRNARQPRTLLTLRVQDATCERCCQLIDEIAAAWSQTRA